MVPLEAMAAATPVIAYNAGGAPEYVQEAVTGVLFDEQTPEALVEAVERFQSMLFDEAVIRERARQFDTAVFRRTMRTFVDNEWKLFSEKKH